MGELKQNNDIYNNEQFILWKKKWEHRSKLNNNSSEKSFKLMREVNPLVIPRNHLVEQALKYATENDDLTKIQDLLKVLKNPYKNISVTSKYQSTPPTSSKKYQTYCGT
jgi:uncharacterized protein YdiU (UPF0061 family)